MAIGPAVSFHPDSFSNERPLLSSWSLESVVAQYKDVERKRTIKTEPDSEAEVLWHPRTAPRELPAILKSVASRLGVSRSVLTKCMSRHFIDWYSDDSGLGLSVLAAEYAEVYKQIKSRAAYSPLRIQAENPALFAFVTPAVSSHMSFSLIRWVVEKLYVMRDFVGGNINDLVMVGFMWSLCCLVEQGDDGDIISNCFVPEVDNFELLVHDRRVDVWALREKYRLREGRREGKKN